MWSVRQCASLSYVRRENPLGISRSTTQRSINPAIAAPTSPNPLTARPTAPFPLLWLDPADELGELPEPVEPEGAPDDVPEAVKEAVGVAEEAG